jgi:hypothetical protein
MSEFVTVHLGLDGVQSGHKDVYWFWQERPYVQWVFVAARVALHRSASSRGYKLSSEGADPRSQHVCVVS